MISRVRHATGIITLLSVGVLVACSERSITGVDAATSTARGGVAASAANLLECPVNGTQSTSALVGPLGGLVSIGGTSISIPAGALLSPVEVSVTVPESNLMEVDISVSGVEHFIFELPVVVTLSYARCNRNLTFTPLSVWHIDTETNELLEQMPSIDNKLLKTITFTTGHLSGYAVAN